MTPKIPSNHNRALFYNRSRAALNLKTSQFGFKQRAQYDAAAE
jgi:hypothetical protein